MWIFDAINIFSKGINTMADSVDQADAALKSADAAWTAARSKIHPSNTLNRRINLLKSDGADNPSSPDHAAYLNYKNQYDAAVAEEAAAKQEYLAAQENYKKAYSSQDQEPKTGTTEEPLREPSSPPQSPTEENTTGNPSPAQAVTDETGPPAENFQPQEVSTSTDNTYADYDQPTTTYADYDIPPAVSSSEDTEAARADLMNDIDAAQDANLRELLGQNDNVASSIMGSVDQVRSSPTRNLPRNQRQKDDWRIRLSLAPSAKYLYKNPNIKVSDLLYPLTGTDGVIFPYMPQINSSYKANYDPSDLTHSNFKTFFYKNSSVEEIQIVADFTAQDSSEANYMLAVIHFFKSVTKMFYGQDGKNGGPRSGTPPPLCYLNGLGTYQFNDHPVLVTSFSYNLPNDVDYIRAGASAAIAGQNTGSTSPKQSSGFSFDLSSIRAKISGLTKGSISNEPQFNSLSKANATYVPTKIQITIGLLPVVTRNDMSKNFSLEDYATGKLLKGSERNGRGIW